MIEELKQLGLSNYEAKALEVLFKNKENLRDLSKKGQSTRPVLLPADSLPPGMSPLAMIGIS